jgi:hypothetical protein
MDRIHPLPLVDSDKDQKIKQEGMDRCPLTTTQLNMDHLTFHPTSEPQRKWREME